MKVLRNSMKNNIKEGKCFTVYKILKYHNSKNTKRVDSSYMVYTIVLIMGWLRSVFSAVPLLDGHNLVDTHSIYMKSNTKSTYRNSPWYQLNLQVWLATM